MKKSKPTPATIPTKPNGDIIYKGLTPGEGFLFITGVIGIAFIIFMSL